MFANCQLMGLDLAFPDICKTPPALLPIPYPNIALGPMGIPNAWNILLMGMPAHNLLTTIPLSNGDNAGLALGLISPSVMGPSRHITCVPNVLFKCIPATRLTSISVQNRMNTVGGRIVPSQIKVLLLGGGGGGARAAAGRGSGAAKAKGGNSRSSAGGRGSRGGNNARRARGRKDDRVKCFNPRNSSRFKKLDPAGKKKFGKDYARQLRRQEDELNKMSANDFMKARQKFKDTKTGQAAAGKKNPSGRNPRAAAAQRKYRKEQEKAIADSIRRSMRKNPKYKEMSPKELRAESQRRAQEQMSDLAALHEPDMVAGGWTNPAPKGLGRSDVNSDIGGNWTRDGRLDAMEQIAQEMIDNGMGDKNMNLSLRVCPP